MELRNLDVQDVTTILDALSQQPLAKTYNTFVKVHSQYNAQLQAVPPATDKVDPRPATAKPDGGA